MDFMFSVFPIFFAIVFAFVFFFIISTFVRGWKQERKNDRSPRLTVEATVVAKRMAVYGGHRNTAGHTSYYATFQVSSGDRMELQVPYSEYGYLVEHDSGMLVFQGTHFLSFERT